jgi:hypothetical protein
VEVVDNRISSIAKEQKMSRNHKLEFFKFFVYVSVPAAIGYACTMPTVKEWIMQVTYLFLFMLLNEITHS